MRERHTVRCVIKGAESHGGLPRSYSHVVAEDLEIALGEIREYLPPLSRFRVPSIDQGVLMALRS